MATRTSLDTKVPPPTPSSTRSPELPTIGSLAVTDVIDSTNLQGSPRSSSQAMQDLQRQQARPSAAPTLSPARVNTSVADDWDSLLDETLEEFKMSPAAASSSPVPAAAPSLPSVQNDLDHQDMEQVLVSLIGLQFAGLLVPADSKDLAHETTQLGQILNSLIGYINQVFKSLLAQSANPEPWLERESKTSLFCNTHPFGASCFLMAHLDKATAFLPHLNQRLLAEWKDNYQQCVLLLKRQGLDRYNETEFPFSAQTKPMVSLAQTMGEQFRNPLVAELIRQQMSAFTQDPQGIMDQLQAQHPQFAEAMKAQMGALGSEPLSIEAIVGPQIQPVLSFFQKLDQVLQEHKDAGAVEAWLKAETAKSTYQHPFFFSKDILSRAITFNIPEKDFPPSVVMLKVLYTGCCERLTALGLQRFVNEAASKEALDNLRQDAAASKEDLQLALSKSLAFLRPLSAELKKLDLAPAALDANRQTIEGWITRCRTAGTYYPPFVACGDLCQYGTVFEGLVDGAQLSELNMLLPFCREQLIALGLNTYVQDIPVLLKSTVKPAAAAASAPKKALSDTERFKREVAFFRELIKIDDKIVDQWLKDNSPKSDYPLLWAKKRMSQLSQFRDTVSMDLRRDWRMCAETSLEKVPNSAHVDLGQIPADASPELRAFLA